MSIEKINYSKSGYVLVLRPEFFSICDGSPTANALLSLFVYQFECKQRAWENTKAGKSGESAPVKALLKRYKKERLVELVMGIGKEGRVIDGIKLLERKGFISVHNNPFPGCGHDKAKFILVHPEAINQALEQIKGEPDSNDPDFYEAEYLDDAHPKKGDTVCLKTAERHSKNPRAINKNTKNFKKKHKTDSHTPSANQGNHPEPDVCAANANTMLSEVAKCLPIPEWLDRDKFQQWYRSTLTVRGVLSEEQITLSLQSLITQVVTNRWDQGDVINKAILGGWIIFYPCNQKGEPERNQAPSEEWKQIHGQHLNEGLQKADDGLSAARANELAAEVRDLSRLLGVARSQQCRVELERQIRVAQKKLKIVEQNNTSPSTD